MRCSSKYIPYFFLLMSCMLLLVVMITFLSSVTTERCVFVHCVLWICDTIFADYLIYIGLFVEFCTQHMILGNQWDSRIKKWKDTSLRRMERRPTDYQCFYFAVCSVF